MKYEKMLNDFFDKFKCSNNSSFSNFFDGFNKGELNVLRYLNSIKKETSSGELSNIMNVSTARVASILNSLESKNLIIRKSDSDDKRKILVDITDDGVKLTQDMKEEVSKRISYVIEEIGVEKFREYLDITSKVNDILKNYEEDIC